MLNLFLFFLCLALALASPRARTRLVLNALDEEGLTNALEFANLVSNDSSVDDIRLFVSQKVFEHASSQVQVLAKEKYKAELLSASPLADLTRGRKTKVVEKVTAILEALQKTVRDVSSSASSAQVLSLSFRNGTKLVPTKLFPKAFERFFSSSYNSNGNGNNNTSSSSAQELINAADALLVNDRIILMGKNKRLTSVSDWHDLLAIGFSAPSTKVQQWLDVFTATYMNYANRKAFTLLDPRPAMLEANLQYYKNNSRNSGSNSKDRHKDKETGVASNSFAIDEKLPGAVHFFHLGEICTGKECQQGAASVALLEIKCRSPHEITCLTINEPEAWKHSLDRGGIPDSYEAKAQGTLSHAHSMDQGLTHAMWFGVGRFRDATDDVTPRKFCWEVGSDVTENIAEARIVFNITSSYKFEHPKERPAAKASVVFLTGMEGGGARLDEKLYVNLSKMMYCKRHGYRFLQLLSNQYRHYFASDLFANLGGTLPHTPFFSGTMSKVVMVVDAMLMNPDADWIIWTDDDVYINPGWLYAPLDIFFDDVPKDKVFVASNYRSAFTNVFAVRNTKQGRRLVYDWLAISLSGYIECHGYDQAAIGTLIIQRIYGSFDTHEPFHHTCMYSDEGNVGCNSKGDWSCDFDFETTLYKIGFQTPAQYHFFDLKISSYSKGCANDYVPDFHIITETDKRPRLQCGHCTRLTQIDAAGHWDGPLGGGNDKLHPGSLDSWFFNHKAEFLLFESYLKHDNCKRVDDIVPACSPHVQNLHTRADPHFAEGQKAKGSKNAKSPPQYDLEAAHHEYRKSTRQLISITDGYAFEIETGTYCRVTNAHMLMMQKEHTYMKEYTRYIALAKTYSKQLWEESYRNYSGGEGRSACGNKDVKCDHGAHPLDGQQLRQMRPGEDEWVYFENKDFCSQCREKEKHLFKKDFKSLDCRTDWDIKEETRRQNNQDSYPDRDES